MIRALRKYFAGGRLVRKLNILHLALRKVEGEYKEYAKQLDGDLTWYGVGVWLPGIGREDNEKVEGVVGKRLGVTGWAADTPSRRRCLFAQITVEASTPERAGERACMELVQRFEDAGIGPSDAFRIEVEPLPQEYVDAIEKDRAEQESAA